MPAELSPPIRVVSAQAVRRALDIPATVAAIRDALLSEAAAPHRHHHAIPDGAGRETTLILMPAWNSTVTQGGYLGVKLATVAPGNAAKGLPTVIASYLLHDAATGQPLALLDGTMLTLRRTAAASALAADALARRDASRLLVVGTGALAPHLAEAHAAMRPIRRIDVWGRDPAKARATAEALAAQGLPAEPAPDLEAACRAAEIITCATTSRVPLVRGDWLRPGTHLDLVGGFTPEMREADDDAMRRARVFIDGDAANHEAGDIVQTGVHAVADLRALAKGLAGRGLTRILPCSNPSAWRSKTLPPPFIVHTMCSMDRFRATDASLKARDPR